jgi:tail lysozyme
MKSFIKKVSVRRLICLALACVILAEPLGTTKVLAIPDLYFYSSNDILFFDPDASCGVGSDATGVPSLVGKDNPEKIWNFLVAKGLSNEQAAGVLGNIQAESGFDPGVVERSGGGGFGIVQWTGGRRTALEAAAAQKGVPVNDLGFQLEYLYQELTARGTNRPEYKQFPNEWEMLKGQPTINDALVAFHHEFEISHLMNKPDPRAAVIEARGQFAADAFASFSSNTPGAGGSEDCATAPTGNLAQTAAAYAWPDYRGSGYTNKKPEYETAVQKAKGEGRYTGDACHGGGVDCGAFVTLLMNDSGFEPAYNFNGRGGNTSTQLDWARKNWLTLGKGGAINAADLQPGDVAIKDGHTYAFAGMVPGFGEGDSSFKGVVSASQCDRAPMAGHESLTDNDFTWFRKK